MTELTSPHPISTFRIWLSWTILTTVSALLGLVLTDALVLRWIQRLGNNVSLSGDSGVIPLLLFGLGMVFFVGTLVGFAQSMVLRDVTPAQDTWATWTLASAMGMLLALFSTVILANMIWNVGDPPLLIWAIVPGIVVGLVQSLLLGRILPRANGWVLAVSVAGIAASISGYIMRIVILPPTVGTRHSFPFYPLNEAILWGASWIVGALVFGAITGAMLVRLLKQVPEMRRLHRNRVRRVKYKWG